MSSPTVPPPVDDARAQRQQKLSWLGSVAFFCVLFWALPPVLGALGRLARQSGVPGPLVLVLAIPVGLVLFFWVAKWFTVARMPRHIGHEFFARQLLSPANSASPGARPPLPAPDDSPGKPPAYDWQSFERHARDLAALGFVPLSAWKRLDANGVVDTVWADAWLDPQGRCLATISQTLPLGSAPWPVIVAFSGRFANGGTLTVSNRRPYAMAWMLRQPRHAWVMCPDFSAERLWSEWQSQAAAQSLFWKAPERAAPASIAEVQADLDEQYADFRAAVARKNVALGLAEGLAGQFATKDEWRGAPQLSA